MQPKIGKRNYTFNLNGYKIQLEILIINYSNRELHKREHTLVFIRNQTDIHVYKS